MKVILRVHEGYSESTWWRLFWEYLMKVILRVPDDGYSESTWWRLFWEYLMKVLPISLDCPFLTAPSFFSSVCFFWSLYCLFYGFWIFLWNLQTFWYTCYVFIYSIVHAKGDKQNINDCTKCSRLVIRPLFRPFGLFLPNAFKFFGYFDIESTWWRLFWEYMMKVILRVHDEGYSESTWWRLFWEYFSMLCSKT
jgi:hypothetical protein